MSTALDVDNVTPPRTVVDGANEKPPAPTATVWLRFRSFIWDSDTHLKSAEERRLLWKLDTAMLTCLCLGFFCKYLDQSNLNNAYVSGLKEDLGWSGNQLTYATSLYTAAYAIMQIPSTLIVQKVRPSLWLGGCELAWCALTFAQAGAHNTSTMYAFRFLVGIFESAFFPVGLYLLGSWYTPTELAKRTAIFHFTAPAGVSFAGYMQAAVYKTLNNHGGLEGWRWLYIICGVITLPCGLLVFFVLPDHPSSGKRWYLTDAELELAQERMRKVKRTPTNGLFEKAVIKRIFSNWHIYLLPLTYIFYGLSCAGSSYFAIYLKSTKKYSVELVNILPTFISVIQAVTTLAYGFLSDYTGSRFWFTFGPMLFGAIPTGILAVWPQNYEIKIFAFMTLGIQLMTAVIYSWWNEICSADPLERALVISGSNGLQYVMSAWLPLLIFKQTDAPSFRKGFITDFVFVLITLALLILVKILHGRELQERALVEEEYLDSPRTAEDSLDKKDTIKNQDDPLQPTTVLETDPQERSFQGLHR
ncbi:uncharacterized protein I303_104046 [Kwoniella dejecticola CBS 10117]|uniref:Major facilitator superfamily (MFS) profile domain-containing protein n=1 Tax=Kwoniella dejecticola CBS 10117 TaxID=1296121 RepID=A0A1A6A8G0_9TREE|nr:uncharacterized protein I303_04065 [Kwoniella dejecticola CBS 10117]OBR86341.1 hypothetical protein I303_04065 [Kwoniella dejecticola CBS 10117]